MKREFLVNRNGTTFVKFAGLLDEAHQRGMRSLTTTLVQAPTEENGRVAIFSAVVVMPGADGQGQTFLSHGSAHPGNTKEHMLIYLLEMAETRSMARALRNALNIATCSLEEAEGSEQSPAPARAPRPGACTHCPVSNGQPGNHHKPGCPNKTDQRVARV